MTTGKKTIITTIGILFFLSVLFLILNVFVENKIENKLKEALGSSSGYESLDLDLLSRSIQINGLNYEGEHRQLSVKLVQLEGINYYQYLFNDKIKIKDVTVVEPQVLLIKPDSAVSKQNRNFKKEIHISHLEVKDGLLRYKKEKESKENELYAEFPEFGVSEISVDSSTLKNKIPLNYKSYHLKADTIRANMNPHHFVAAGVVDIDNGRTIIKDFRIVPYYDKNDFDQKVAYEKDRISLRVDSIFLQDLKFHFENDMLFLKNPLTKVAGGDVHIYRNKALPDNPAKRPLYSELLRKAPVKLDFEKIEVKTSAVHYEEKTEPGRPAATLDFQDISGEVENLTNINLDRADFPETAVNANALFQKVSPVHLDLSFNVSNLEDRFVVSGEVKEVPADALNPLLIPSLGIKAQGAIQEAYFTFTGNEDVMTGDLRMRYDHFKVLLLEEDSREKKGFLSAIANLFVDNDGPSGEDKGENITVQRDKNKSFWNFLWTGIRKGMKEALGQV